jgi:hypothetical protein
MKRLSISAPLGAIAAAVFALSSCGDSEDGKEKKADAKPAAPSTAESPVVEPEPEPVAKPAPAPAPTETAPPAAAEVKPAANPGEISLFDGKTLGNWKPVKFGGEGEVRAIPEDEVLLIGMGAVMTGIVWEGELPAKTNYEIELEGMKANGDDFMMALTIPVGDSSCSWVCGGWGGGVVGISSIDDLDASENETATIESFTKGQWYKFKIRVEPDRIQCWLDGNRIIDTDIKDRRISMRPGDVELCVPLGIATFQTRSEFKNIVWRNLEAE